MPDISIVSPRRWNLFREAWRTLVVGAALVVLLGAIAASPAVAQNPPADTPPAKADDKASTPPPAAAEKAPAAAADEPKKSASSEKEKLPEPEDLTLTTSDGVRLALTYYPSNRGREAIPVVLLHMAKGSRTDYKYLAAGLQSQGYAVVVPDLRGHGDSTKQVGREKELSAAKLPIEQYKLMVDKDMYAVKEFLWERNNAKELNLNKLCVVGAEMGASVAINFTAFDAVGYGDSDHGAFYGPLQLGLFVKSLVLLSPEVSFRGLPLTPLPDDIRKTVPVLILVGKEDSRSYDEAERVSKIFKRIAPKKEEDMTYFFKPLATKLQGTKLLEPKALGAADNYIVPFLKLRLKDADQAREWSWKTLKKPHENG